ncbi:NAD(P)-dependent oxidoreductase [Anaerolineales bacterium HSG25]|nr:NAD(P)-dependent oxidoreductase [Anaerolineales bacterium HSG25]
MSAEKRRPKVLICDAIAPTGVKRLETHADVEVKTGLSQAELISVIPDYEAIVLRSATQAPAEVIKHGLKLKVIARAGARLDNVDVVAAQEQGVQVVNSPDANTLAVAELSMGLLISLARHVARGDQTMKAGKWEKKKLMGMGLAGKTLGIVGFGRIGREVAIRAKAFGMTILVNQRRPTPELNLEIGVESVDLLDLLAQSDFITLHVPFKPETQNMMSTEQFKLMKPTAYLINTARGGVVDEEALLTALNEDQIAGAALDVFREEPAVNNSLAQHERVVATPHIAASTDDAQEAAALTVADKIIEILNKVEVEHILPLQIVPSEKVVPHEHVDPRRVERLMKRLETDQILMDPPLVMEADDHYVVLDGATRSTALKQLGYEHILVQITPPEENLNLHTWFHAICNINLTELLEMLEALPEVTLVDTDMDRVLDEMFEYGGLCYLKTVEGQVLLVLPTTGQNRLDALNSLTNTYIRASIVQRTINDNMISLGHEYPDMAALVVFPEYTVAQVLQVAQSDRVFPAGITRFIIPDRILRLNADLSILKSDKSLREKNQWLHDLLVDKLAQGKIRHYEEPIYLLDE